MGSADNTNFRAAAATIAVRDGLIVARLHRPSNWFTLARPFGRGDRVVEGARLESVCTFTRTEGSNPSLSAIPGQMAPSPAGVMWSMSV